MSINVIELIKSLGKTYDEIFDIGLIPYKTKPKGFSGDEDISLDMVKEGVYLSFKRDGRIFQEITLSIQYENKSDWVFPSELPAPLKSVMSRCWIHTTFGIPNKSAPPQLIGTYEFGWKEQYIIRNYNIPLSMRVSYDLQEMVRSITYLPLDMERW